MEAIFAEADRRLNAPAVFLPEETSAMVAAVLAEAVGKPFADWSDFAVRMRRRTGKDYSLWSQFIDVASEREVPKRARRPRAWRAPVIPRWTATAALMLLGVALTIGTVNRNEDADIQKHALMQKKRLRLQAEVKLQELEALVRKFAEADHKINKGGPGFLGGGGLAWIPPKAWDGEMMQLDLEMGRMAGGFRKADEAWRFVEKNFRLEMLTLQGIPRLPDLVEEIERSRRA